MKISVLTFAKFEGLRNLLVKSKEYIMKFNIIVGMILILISVDKGIAQTVFTVTSTGDGGDVNVGNGICDDGTGNCTLRAALQEANAIVGKDTIEFNIPGDGPHTIQPSTALPAITDPVVIDGYTQPGASPNMNPINLGSNAVLMIEIDGTNAGETVGIAIISGNSIIRGLVINRFSGGGIVMVEDEGNSIEGNFIGTDVTGTVSLGNNANGLHISNSQNNLIGGINPGARNLISGNGAQGIDFFGTLATGNLVQNNYIGTDITGTADLGNAGNGVHVFDAPGNTFGGITPGMGNLISGNGAAGIAIFNSVSSGNLVQGNFIGTDVTGTVSLANNSAGVQLINTPDNIIGGTTEGARNIISGNGDIGVLIEGAGATGNLVQGNYIGTDVSGTVALGNGNAGVFLSESPDNIIGGTTEAARNIISGNARVGVLLYGDSATGNLVQGNYIGTDVSGTVALGNGNTGVLMWEGASDNTVGGSVNAANIIAFNADDGVEVSHDGTGNAILSNSIFSNNQGFPIGTGLGIDLHPDGVRQANDPGDADTGPNNLQNYPEDMLFGVDENRDLIIDYRVDSDPSNSAYPLTVQFFESFPGVIPSTIGDDQGEGKFFLGEDVYALTDFNTGIKTVNFGNSTGLEIANGEFIVATATDLNGNTSEFSFPIRVGIADIMLTPAYAAPGSDSVVVTALVRSDTIGFSLFAEFESPDNTPIETLQLFDDGAHSDESAGDGIFGNAWAVPATEERNYFVDLQVTFDDTLNFEIDNAVLFTSIGPVSYDSLDIRINTGSILFFNLYLINLGLSSTASNISAEISTSDSCVADINSGLRSFGDIAAGATAKSSGSFSIDFSQNCDGDVLLTFDLAVSSDGIVFWSENLEMQVAIVGVDDENTGLPSEYTLSEAYPNPFNPVTQINYALPEAGHTRIVIYDLLGREVTRLIDANMNAGYHSVKWDASNVASGIYFYRLTAGDFVNTKKMVLLK